MHALAHPCPPPAADAQNNWSAYKPGDEANKEEWHDIYYSDINSDINSENDWPPHLVATQGFPNPDGFLTGWENCVVKNKLRVYCAKANTGEVWDFDARAGAWQRCAARRKGAQVPPACQVRCVAAAPAAAMWLCHAAAMPPARLCFNPARPRPAGACFAQARQARSCSA